MTQARADGDRLSPPPPLPRKLIELWPLVLTGTALWAALAVVLLIVRYGFDGHPGVWLPTSLVGLFLGLLGLSVVWWQRAASRRGTKGAQRGL